ncbi:SGNH/GDSL hydrolase family protein [Nocardioides albertanoniae]|uniref:SGNH/GDSL hydrolase family protein n=1 Tax=Nocardioides albertanoniae TaxID=1175486 RepID=UPI001151C2B5|nr:SGNH/GDSL hydrolase family protein [Nocardioides albertanoniae]
MSIRKVPRSVKLLVGVWSGVLVVAVALATAWLVRSPGMNEPVAVENPSESELQVAGKTTVLFGHQSVGVNILDGVAGVYAANDVDAPTVEEVAGSSDATFRHVFVGRNGDPFGKFDSFAAVMGGPAGEEVDVALMKLCYVDINATTDVEAVFDAYVAMMAEVEAAHPDTRFLYTTAALTSDRNLKGRVKAALGRGDRMGPADNVARERYNAMIREKYAATGRLVDIAAAESAGTDKRSHDGSSYYVLNKNLTFDRGHLNETGSRAVASELLKAVAAHSPVA